MTYRSGNRAYSSGTTNISVSKPSGALENDVVVVYLQCDAVRTVTPPDGSWTGSQLDSGSTWAAFYKVLGASEPSSWTFVLSSASGTTATAVAYYDIDTATPVAAGPTFQRNGSDNTSSVAPSVSPGSAGTLVTMHSSSGIGTASTPSGMTERLAASALGGFYGTALFDESVSSGATGTRTSTTGTGNGAGVSIVLKAAGGGDVTAPVLSSPAFTASSSSAGTASVSTDEGNGTLYCVVTQSATSPSAAQIKAGNDHTGSAADFDASQAVSGTGTQNVAVTGLTASTTYYAHFVQDDAAANESNVASDTTGDTTNAANAAPSWSGTPSAMSSKRGQALTPQDVTSLVSDTDTLSYSITGAPTGVSINSSTGVISGTPTAAPGVYACTVEADDGVNSPVSSSSFNITVTQAVLALNAAGFEFGDGNDPATMSVLASTGIDVAAYAVSEWPPVAPVAAAASGSTDSNGRLSDLGDDDLTFGTTYRVIARNPSDGETFAWLMQAS